MINADRFIKAATDNLYTLKTDAQIFQKKQAFQGMELVQDVHRLCLMNMMLHGIEGPVGCDDTLGPAGARLPKANVVLTNPPFGSQNTGSGHREDFTYPTNNRQLAFLQHIYRTLKPGGRAAVVLPDNVLFEDNTGRNIRADLMNKCALHTVLRLPTGIFYAQGVKTNVLFFRRGTTDTGNTKEVWFYDLRANMPSFGKRTPLTRAHFSDFEQAYGKDPNGQSTRKDTGESGRFRRFTREEIAGRNDNLDITWIKSGDNTNDYTLAELLDQIKEKSAAIAMAVSNLEQLIGEVDE